MLRHYGLSSTAEIQSLTCLTSPALYPRQQSDLPGIHWETMWGTPGLCGGPLFRLSWKIPHSLLCHPGQGTGPF